MRATVLNMDPRAIKVTFTDTSAPYVNVFLADGRIISFPVSWSPRLTRATVAQRANYELLVDGELIHWPDVDEDIETTGLLSLGTIVVPPDGNLRIKR